MSDTKHTPGPWRVARAAPISADIGIVADMKDLPAGRVVVAEVFAELRHAGERSTQTKHNAHLIAAAPDLATEGRALRAFLAALTEALDIKDDTCINFAADGKTLASVSLREVFGRWDAAIAKAEGRS